MKKVLVELKAAYDPYKPLWPEWTRFRRCGLTQDEIYAIEIHLRNDFKALMDEPVMFYNRTTFLKKLTLKLKDQYAAFRKWAIDGFMSSLIYIGIKYKWNTFFTTPVPDLFLPAELKQSILKFNVSTVLELLKLQNDPKLKRKRAFEAVLESYSIISKEERKHFKLEKEVLCKI
ncbi:MAG: hypothetical protein ACXVAU_07735 [Mucilaginibacter sp.]